MNEHTWWVVGALAVIVLLAVLLDPWLSPESPTARERREWQAQRDRTRAILRTGVSSVNEHRSARGDA